MFDTSLFAGAGTLLLGALTGFIFGFLLQKAHVTRFAVIVGQFLFRDFTVLKVMLTAIVVGGVGIYAMLAAGMLAPGDLHIKSADILVNAIGGIIFGIGMAILGYCPGTGVGAIGDGARDAIVGLVGMICGAAIYAEVHPALSEHLGTIVSMGKATLPSATEISPWWFIALLVMIATRVFIALEHWEKRRA